MQVFRHKKKIAWLMPSPLEGSGGHRTIFNHINALARYGHQCDVYVHDSDLAINQRSQKSVEKIIERYFGGCEGRIIAGLNVAEGYDLIVATAWWTAKLAAKYRESTQTAYFIQDYEAMFFPMGDDFLQAENSYRLGLKPVTIGRWLSAKMSNDFGVPSQHFPFTADLSVYRPLDGVKRENAVCFVYQPEKHRRCPTIGMEALGALKHYRPDVKIYTFGTERKPSFWFEHEHLGLLDLDACNDLYNRCAVGLCLSSSNPSRIPFEMMAAGLPVVDFYGDNTLYDLPEGACSLSGRDSRSVAKALIALVDDETRRKEMGAAGVTYMRTRDVSRETMRSTEIFNSILNKEYVGETEFAPEYKTPPVTSAFQTDGAVEGISVDGQFPPQISGIVRTGGDATPSLLRRLIRKLLQKFPALRPFARQAILMLNSVLSIEERDHGTSKVRTGD